MLCSYGCNQESITQFKNGKFCCSKSINKCPAIRKKNSEGTKLACNERPVWYKSKGLPPPMTGKVSWNKGLNKHNSEKVRINSESLKSYYETHDGSFAGKNHSQNTKDKISHGMKSNPNSGGYRKGSGKGKHGWYNGIWCDSSWELAWVLYQTDHDVKFRRNLDRFKYQINFNEFDYIPDFILNDDTYVEIKGFMRYGDKEKLDQFPKNKKIILFEYTLMKPILDYVIGKYGKSFVDLYGEAEHGCAQRS